jgi:hypothetical protein
MRTRKDAFNDDLLILGQTLLGAIEPVPTRPFIHLEVSLAFSYSLERIGSSVGSEGSKMSHVEFLAVV